MMLKIVKIAKPYNEEGRCTFSFKEYSKKSGVYLIRYIGQKHWVYIGKGKDVYKQLYSHFQRYINRDIVFNGIAYKNIAIDKNMVECAIILTDSQDSLERDLIKVCQPSLNRRIPKEVRQEPVVIEDEFSHLDWDKINKCWNDYIKQNGKEPF